MAKFYRTEDRTVLLELFGAGSSVENLKNLKANTTDAAVEKHVPVVTQEGNKITVAVSSVEHPMLPEHYIMGVYIETKNGGQLHKFQPGDTPKATFTLADGDEFVAAYEYTWITRLYLVLIELKLKSLQLSVRKELHQSPLTQHSS